MTRNTDNLPLVTIVLLAYNQERFISEAVSAAIAQDYPKLEIVLSDDCSNDSTFEIIQALASEYSGTHQININKNPVNLGLSKHFNKVVGMARGEIIIVAAGDDISLPMRVSKTVEILCTNPTVSFVSFQDLIINAEGRELVVSRRRNFHAPRKVTLEDYIAGRAPRLSGASRGFRKVIFDTYGNLNEACPTEDTPYILRGLMMGDAIVSNEPGILYRKHGKNISAPHSLHRMNYGEVNAQYLRDATIARSLGLISDDMLEKIKGWAEKKYKQRLFRSDLYNSSNKFLFLVNEIIFSNKLGVWDKLKLMRRFLR